MRKEILFITFMFLLVFTVPTYADIVYDNFNFSTDDSPQGMSYNDTHYWVISSSTGYVKRYNQTGDYDWWNFSVATECTGTAYDVIYNASYFWVSCNMGHGVVYQYNDTGHYNSSFTNVSELYPWGLAYNDTYLWVTGTDDDLVSRYFYNATYRNWTYDDWNFSVAGETGAPTDLAYGNDTFWVLAGAPSNSILRYDVTGSYQGANHSMNALDTDVYGLFTNISHFWMTGTGTDRAYRLKTEYVEFLTNNYTTPVIEGQITNFNMSLNTTIEVVDIIANLVWNGTVYEPDSMVQNGYIYNFYRDILIPDFDVNETSVNFYWNVSIISALETVNDTTVTNSQTVFALLLTNCSEAWSNVTALNFSLRDEVTNAHVVGNFNYTFWYWTDNQSANDTLSEERSGASYYEVCIFPAWAEYTADMIGEYWASGYSIRSYFLDEASVDNVTDDIYLYLLNSSDSTRITMYVYDATDTPQPNVYIQAQRYFVGTNTYRTVSISRTDSEGTAHTWLYTNDTWYRFILTRDGSVLREYQPMQITTNEITFHITDIDLPAYYDYWDTIAWGCAFNNATNYFRCTVTDVSGRMQEVWLNVTQITTLGTTTLCYNSSTASSSTLSCYLGANVTGNRYAYQLTGRFCCSAETWWLLDSGFLEFLGGSYFGLSGLFVAILLIIALAGMGHWNPSAMVLFGVVGLVASFMFGLLSIGFGSIVGLSIGGIIIAYKMRT